MGMLTSMATIRQKHGKDVEARQGMAENAEMGLRPSLYRRNCIVRNSTVQ